MANIKIIYLNYNTCLIGEYDFLEDEPSHFLDNCYIITVDTQTSDFQFVQYPIFTKNRGIIIHSKDIFTIVDPTNEIIRDYYITLTKENRKKTEQENIDTSN